MEENKLYKCKAITDYTLDALKQDKIWYCNPKYFNDIFDTYFFVKKIREQLTFEELKKLHNDSIIPKDVYDNICLNLDGDVGILSLSKRWDSNTMWSHYGDYHRGFCMEFEFKGKDKQGYIGDLYAHKVEYNAFYKSKEDVITNPSSQWDLFLQKSSEWEYEDEYRVVLALNVKRNIENISRDILQICSNYSFVGEYDIIGSQIKLLCDLLENAYLDDDDVIKQVEEIITIIENKDTENLSVKALINQIKGEFNKEGSLYKYPSKLTSIIFGYRTDPKDKKDVRKALEHLGDIKYKKIVSSKDGYKLFVEDETFN